jgi:hypothetical protein
VRSATTACTSVQGRYLAVYLNDHLAGSTAIVELVRRAAREHEGIELGGFLTASARTSPGTGRRCGR